MQTRKQKEQLFLLLGLVVLVLLAANSLVWFFRADLTRNKAYTISPATVEYLAGLSEPVRLTYYVSPEILNKLSQIQNIADLLEEYGYALRNKLQVRIKQVDSEKDKDMLQGKGIRAQQYQVVDDNEMSVELVYSGLVIEYLNRTKTIPFIADPANVEYQLVLAIQGVVDSGLPKLGILSGKPEYDPGQKTELIRQFFTESFQISFLTPGEVIPPDIDVLMVAGDETLTEADARNLDAWIMAGKNTILALDTYGIDLGQSLEPRAAGNGPVRQLCESYGFKIKSGWVLDTKVANLPVQKNVQGMVYQMSEPYAPWVRSGSASVNRSHFLTAQLPFIDFLWASPIEFAPGREHVTVLASSSANALFLEHPDNADPYLLKTKLGDTALPRSAMPLAVLVDGGVTSPYGTANTGKEGSLRLVLVGDSDFASDLIQISNSTGNMDFMRNLFEWMGYDEKILALRNREIQNARLDRISDKATRSLVITLAQLVNIVVIPAVVIVLGIIRLVSRRRRAAESYGESPNE